MVDNLERIVADSCFKKELVIQKAVEWKHHPENRKPLDSGFETIVRKTCPDNQANSCTDAGGE